ncbi:MAG: membrane protein insertase YidC, partial [Gemmatimonadetes bacterium]|nr:membrane protein insertase YidC [Gemmatimonadota bacterium]
MSTEGRFVMALALMFGVIWGTNKLFPPIIEEPVVPAEVEPGVAGDVPSAVPAIEQSATDAIDAAPPAADPQAGAASEAGPAADLPRPPAQAIVVESPTYRFEFTSRGASLESAELLDYQALNGPGGPVQLIPRGTSALTKRVVVGSDTLMLADLDFDVQPADGLRLSEGDGPRTLRFTHDSPRTPLRLEIAYTFRADDYLVDVTASVQGVDRPLLITGLGQGLAFAEADSAQEARLMSWVGNHLNDGIRATELRKVERPEIHNGPYMWAGVKSKYFVVAVLPGAESGEDGPYIGGVITVPGVDEMRPDLAVAQSVGSGGTVDYRLYMGPQVYSRLQALGADLEEVNPYGWKWLRPLIRPFVVATLWVLNFLHDNLNVGYGWVLVIFGVLMRVALWPLNQKAMRAQMRNMAVQPMIKEIQTKYKDNPEKLQKEMMRMYKEYGFNPLGGCLPMLLPWPVLIALFFVFQNTIELRGVPFYWLPDLSAKDPFFILPIVLAVSMFFLQFISFRSMPQ